MKCQNCSCSEDPVEDPARNIFSSAAAQMLVLCFHYKVAADTEGLFFDIAARHVS